MTGKRQAILDKQGNQHKYVKKHSQKKKKRKKRINTDIITHIFFAAESFGYR